MFIIHFVTTVDIHNVTTVFVHFVTIFEVHFVTTVEVHFVTNSRMINFILMDIFNIEGLFTNYEMKIKCIGIFGKQKFWTK